MARSDESIKQDVIDQLKANSRIDASGIGVRLDNGIVTLSGTVPDLITRQRAAIDASLINGVTSVKNDLNVHYIVGVVDDDELRSRIENILKWSSGLDEKKINVTVSAGHISLFGYVVKYTEKVMAEHLASNICGTLGVTNKIAVVPTTSNHDESVAGKVIKSIAKKTNIDMNIIDIKVKDGVVTLSGTVPNGMVLHAVDDAAGVVPGVIDVINRIKVVPI